MHFKKNSFSYLIFALLSFFSPTTSAIEVPGSGIDWENSTMQVEFDKEVSGVRNSTCFNDLSPNYVDNTTISPYDDLNRTITLDLLGYSDENYDPIITNCFLEAGDYRVTITTQDFATNITVLPPVLFTVLAGSPSQYQEDGVTPASTFTQISCVSPIADNSDTCTFQLLVRDQYLNPVTQLDTFSTAKIYSDSIFPEDANKGVLFRDGLRVDSVVLGDGTAKNNFTLAIAGGDVVKTFSLTATAPTIAQSGEFRGVNQPFLVDFEVELPTINASGAIDTGTLVTFSFDEFSRNLQFSTPIESYITIDGTTTPDIILGNTVVLQTAKPTQLFGTEPANVDLYLEYHDLPYEFGLYADAPFSTVPYDTIDAATFVNQTYANNHSFEAANPPISQNLQIKGNGGAAISNPQDLAIASDIAYTLSGDSIRYPSHAIGGPGISVSLLGVSIEGLSQTVASSNYFLNLDSSKGFLVGKIRQKDVREQIYRNTFSLVRTLEPKGQGSFNSWFNGSGVEPVALVDGDLVLNGNTFLPIGERTTVIRNGNLIIKGEVEYKYTNRLDSFAFILINDKVEEFPDKGNVLVEDNVKRISGTYVLDGGLMSIPRNTNNATVDDAAQGFGDNDSHQLVLDGVLLSHNTLGGAYDALFGGSNIPNDFITPWGTISDLIANSVPIPFGKSDWDEVAKLYDLHLVRQWFPDDPVTPSNCVEDGSPAACITNRNAFVIRVDNKITQLPPPGFKAVETILR